MVFASSLIPQASFRSAAGKRGKVKNGWQRLLPAVSLGRRLVQLPASAATVESAATTAAANRTASETSADAATAHCATSAEAASY
jgi:hypothetical protein